MKISGTTAIGAGGRSGNVLAGFPESLLLAATYVSVIAIADVVGVTADYRRGVTPLLGVDGSEVNVLATLATLDRRIDTIIDRVAAVGQQSLYFTATGGAANVRWTYEIPD